MAFGRFFSAEEDRADASVVVLSDALTRQLDRARPASAFVGDSVLFQGKPYLVVGVLAPSASARGATAYMPTGAATPSDPTGCRRPAGDAHGEGVARRRRNADPRPSRAMASNAATAARGRSE